MTDQPDLTGLPSATEVEAAHQAEVRERRRDGRIAQLEAQLRAAHSDLNRVVADAGDGPFGDGIRYAADRIRPHLQVSSQPGESREQP
ncbi:hypothetical protein ACWD25_25340 [Streptomyces sp. NPDC002920]